LTYNTHVKAQYICTVSSSDLNAFAAAKKSKAKINHVHKVSMKSEQFNEILDDPLCSSLVKADLSSLTIW